MYLNLQPTSNRQGQNVLKGTRLGVLGKLVKNCVNIPSSSSTANGGSYLIGFHMAIVFSTTQVLPSNGVSPPNLSWEILISKTVPLCAGDNVQFDRPANSTFPCFALAIITGLQPALIRRILTDSGCRIITWSRDSASSDAWRLCSVVLVAFSSHISGPPWSPEDQKKHRSEGGYAA